MPQGYIPKLLKAYTRVTISLLRHRRKELIRVPHDQTGAIVKGDEAVSSRFQSRDYTPCDIERSSVRASSRVPRLQHNPHLQVTGLWTKHELDGQADSFQPDGVVLGKLDGRGAGLGRHLARFG